MRHKVVHLLSLASIMPSKKKGVKGEEEIAPTLQGASWLYSPSCRERLSEKSRTSLQRSLTGHLNGTFQPVLTFVYRPNLRSKCCSNPFSDSLRRVVPGTWASGVWSSRKLREHEGIEEYRPLYSDP